MLLNRYLKLKSNKKNKKIYIPQSYNDLIEKIASFLPNNEQNKIYQIYDTKLGTIIKDQNDYQMFLHKHESENQITLLINLIDKNSINKIENYQPENSSCIFLESCIKPKDDKKEEEKYKENFKEKELTEEEKIKESIRLLVQSKLKTFEANIINAVKNKDKPIHKGIKCNGCGINDIRGIRYKCSTCQNYNLCEDCEDIIDHNHVFVKIKEPKFGEDELTNKINESILKFSKNVEINNYDYSIEPNIFFFKKTNLLNVAKITIKNNGNLPLKKGYKLKCIKEKSNCFGNNIDLEKEIGPGNSIQLDLIFDDDKNDYSQNELYSSFIFIDDKNNQIGNVQNFIIKIS